MVDVIGHIGMGLIWLAVVGWLAYDGQSALGFIALGIPFSLFPDIDLWLAWAFAGVKHHGVVHTVLFVSVTALVVGAVLGRWVVPWLRERYLSGSGVGNRYAYAIGAVWIGGLSHLSADILSAPDIADALEPFWPLYRQSLGIDVFYYSDPVVNWGLFLAGLALTGVLWWQVDTVTRAPRPPPRRVRRREERRIVRHRGRKKVRGDGSVREPLNSTGTTPNEATSDSDTEEREQ